MTLVSPLGPYPGFTAGALPPALPLGPLGSTPGPQRWSLRCRASAVVAGWHAWLVGLERTPVYTDGACLGNPGPGGWAWAVPRGRWRSGAERLTTNQRMELAAVLDAARSLDGALEIVSDSTYVVNCFRQGWWVKWVANGWRGANRQPVANRDLWEPLVELYRELPGRLSFRWVKGHASDPFNNLVDHLAAMAATSQLGGSGDEPPGAWSFEQAGEAGPADKPRPRNKPGPRKL